MTTAISHPSPSVAPIQIRQLHSYRVHLIPRDTPAENIEPLASAGMLRTERVRAPDAEQAARNARVIFGMHVHTVERIDTTTGAAA